MRKLLIFLLLMGLSLQNIYAQASEPDGWATDAINKVADSGIVNMDRVQDYGAPITRQAYGYMIYQLYEYLAARPIGTDVPLSIRDSFTDLDYELQSEQGDNDLIFGGTDNLYLEALKGVGLIEGYPDGTYRPTDYITREEIRTLYVRRFEDLGYELEASEVIFEDESSISDWSFESVKKCYSTGLIQGVGNNHVNPKGYATVQESLVVMSRIIGHNQFEAEVWGTAKSSKQIVSNGKNTYSISFDVFGRATGIAHYEDYTYLEEIYNGALGDTHLYMLEESLYFFDEHGQLMVYDGMVTTTSFMASHRMDDWFMEDHILHYSIEGLWLAYDLQKGLVATTESPESRDIYLEEHQLIYNGAIIEEGVVSFDQIGHKVYWLSESEHLYARNISNGDFVDYGEVGATTVVVSGNYLILVESAINGSEIVRYIPIFDLESYLY